MLSMKKSSVTKKGLKRQAVLVVKVFNNYQHSKLVFVHNVRYQGLRPRVAEALAEAQAPKSAVY